MSNRKFTKLGSVILESDDGDIMFAYPGRKIDSIVSVELLQKMRSDESAALIFARQFANFVLKLRSVRWTSARKNIEAIRARDAEFADSLTRIFEAAKTSHTGGVAEIRVIESKIAFWMRENESDDVIETHEKFFKTRDEKRPHTAE